MTAEDDGPFRPISAEERAIIERLLERPFDGADSIRAQLGGVTGHTHA